ncbi:MAG: hypothetical protein FRX49_06436 [Trebouxia sp. A1-2]|nr:MAG: hypothetical protein FRX49_06436 [Trebouxia sp. A1-2]
MSTAGRLNRRMHAASVMETCMREEAEPPGVPSLGAQPLPYSAPTTSMLHIMAHTARAVNSFALAALKQASIPSIHSHAVLILVRLINQHSEIFKPSFSQVSPAGPVQLLKQNHTNPTSSQLSKRAPGKHTVSVLREMNQPACGAQSDQGLAALSIGIRGGSVISSQQLQQSGSSRLTSSDQAGSNEQIVAKKGVSKPASAGKLRAAVSPTPTGQQYILQDVVGMGFDPGNERLAARQPESQILKGLKGQAEQRTLSSSGCERRNRPFLGRAQQQSSCAAALCIPSQLSTCSDPSNHASLQPISVQGLNNSPAGPDKQKPCRREPARQASDASQGRAGRVRPTPQQADATAKDLPPAACLQAEGKGCH